MSDKHIRHFRCPCCNEKLEFDVRTNHVRRPEAATADALDDLIADQRHASRRLEQMFDGATSGQSKEQQRLDKLFDEARESAEQDGDDGRPPNPFDLD